MYLSQARILLVSVIIPVILISCSQNKRIGRQRVTLDTLSVSAKKSAMEIYRATTTKAWELIHTSVALDFNLKDKTANGKAKITLKPYFYATDSLSLDAKSMQVEAVTVNGQTVTYTYKNDYLNIHFAGKYTNSDTIELYVKYKAMPYAVSTNGSAAINDDKGLYFINADYSVPNKPQQIWTQGETEANSHWVPTIDKPNQRTTTEISLTVPDSFTTLSNGYLANETPTVNGYKICTWKMDKPIQVYAMMFAIGKFSIVKDEWKGKDVSYYVEPAYAPYARKMFNNTPEMIDYFSKVTGVPYPWNKYSQVVVRDYVSGAMENTSATLCGEFMNQNFREIADDNYENVVSHELFHQWFGDYVTAESWSNLTLNESFATYGEQLWRAHKYGKSSADNLAMNDMWSYVYGLGKTNDAALVRFHYADKEDLFDRISYQKGASILRYLNSLIGNDAFSKAMSIYLNQNALQGAEATQWRLAIEEATGQDWNWFFSQWYNRGGHPVLDIKHDYDDVAKQVTVTVTQTQKDFIYRLPIKAAIYYNANNTTEDWTLVNKKEVFTYSYKNGERPVVLPDAEYMVVGELQHNFEPWQWLRIYKQSNDNIISKHYAVLAAQKKPDDTSAQAIINLALNDTEPEIRTSVLVRLASFTSSKWQDKWKGMVEYIAINDGSNNVRAAAFDVLGAWKIMAAKQAMYNALSDSSYSVAGSALSALAVIEKDTVYTIAKRLLATEPKAALRSAIWDIVGEQGNAGDVSVFADEALFLSGRAKIECAQSLSAYLQNVKDTTAFERAVAVFQKMITTEAIKSYRYAMAASLYEAGTAYKERIDNSKTNKEQAEAKQKLRLIKAAAEQVVKLETDEENLKEYKKYMKSLFGNDTK